MNEQERRKALYDAMGSIDPALVEQATHHRKNRRISLIIRIVLVLAILAVLVVAVLMHPGVRVPVGSNTLPQVTGFTCLQFIS